MRQRLVSLRRMAGGLTALLVVFGLLSGVGYGAAGDTERVSISSAGFEGNGWSRNSSVSGDGRYIAFHSSASDVVTGDTNGDLDIFLHDRETGMTSRVSLTSGEAQATGPSYDPSISDSGRIVAFSSQASDLVPNDTNGSFDIFMRRLVQGSTARVSVSSSEIEANNVSYSPAISGDGRHVAFESYATNLVADDTNGVVDIFVRSHETGTTERVSVDSAGFEADDSSFAPSISSDGRYVAFSSNSDSLTAADTNGRADIFVHDRDSGTTELVSVKSDGQAADGDSFQPSISADGRIVAFDSVAENLVDGDTNGSQDVFVHDRDTGETTLVSVSSSGLGSDDTSYDASLSADGRYVAFTSWSTTFLTADLNGLAGDVFVHDRMTGETLHLSKSTGGVQGNDSSIEVSLSGNGQLAAFTSHATNLVSDDTNSHEDIFVHEVPYPPPPTSTTSTTTTSTTTTTTVPPLDECQSGFVDTAGHLFEGDISCIADAGITRGCNPPANDYFCPDDYVTRGQMAAFLVRGLGLPPASDQQLADTAASVFRSDIDALAAEGITRGCNPPANDRFCPDDRVSRGQMAAFLTRALQLPPSATDSFVDDDSSVFQADIGALAEAGVTKGCNPPLNDRFCPDDYVTRGEMAAFLNRSVVRAVAR